VWGRVRVAVGELPGPAGTIPATAIDVGSVSYRLSRITSEGSVYTIAPRLIVPGSVLKMPERLARRIWLTVRTPSSAAPGVYKGAITVRPENGQAASLPVEFR